MSEMKNVDLKIIVASKTNPRKTFDQKRLDELTASVKDKGVLQPILIRPFGSGLRAGYEVVSGERRYRAAIAAGLKEIPAVIQDLDDNATLEIQIIENLHRADIHPLEEAEGYETLMKKKEYAGIDQLAVKIGKSKSYIYARMKLCALVPAARKSFYDGTLTASTALLIARIPVNLQPEALKDITQGYGGIMSYRSALDHLQRKYTLQLKDAPFDTKDAALCPKAGACTVCPKRSGSQPELFPDIKRADVCTDPICFKEKKEAYYQRKISEAKKQGLEILKTEQVFEKQSWNDDPGHGFVEANEKCHNDPKGRTYGQLLGLAKKKPSLVINKKGDICEVVRKAAAITAAQEAGIKFERDPGRNPKAMSEQKVINRVLLTQKNFYIENFIKAADSRAILAIALDMVLHTLGWNNQEDILKGEVKTPDETDTREFWQLGEEKMLQVMSKVVKRYIQMGMGDDEELAFILEKLSITMSSHYVIKEAYLNAMTKDELTKLIKELGINVEGGIAALQKKSDFVKVILAKAPKGKIPAELQSKKGKSK